MNEGGDVAMMGVCFGKGIATPKAHRFASGNCHPKSQGFAFGEGTPKARGRFGEGPQKPRVAGKGPMPRSGQAHPPAYTLVLLIHLVRDIILVGRFN